jgi:hypothetical protein
MAQSEDMDSNPSRRPGDEVQRVDGISRLEQGLREPTRSTERLTGLMAARLFVHAFTHRTVVARLARRRLVERRRGPRDRPGGPPTPASVAACARLTRLVRRPSDVAVPIRIRALDRSLSASSRATWRHEVDRPSARIEAGVADVTIR